MKRQLILGLLIVLAGCSSASTIPTTSTTEQLGTSSKKFSASRQLPLDWITSHYTVHSFLIGRAEAYLTSECMRKLGFEYGFENMFQVQPAEFTINRRHITFSPERARAHGYTSEDTPNDNREPLLPSNESELKRFLIALTGNESGNPISTAPLLSPATGEQIGTQSLSAGCQNEAIRNLFGSSESYRTYTANDLWAQNLQLASSDDAQSSSEVLEMYKNWSRCMVAKGFNFSKPSESQGFGWPMPRPSATEKKAAEADMTCRISSHYLDVLAQSEFETQTKVVEKFALQLNEIKTFREELEAKAIEIVSSKK